MRIERLPILILYPHSRCNCRCVMCDIWKVDAVEEIGAADLERHVASMQALAVEWVVFSGGEPLMHSDLFRLCRRLHGLGIRTTILTTGLLLERHAPRIVECVDDVIVSLDGPPEVHDRIRRMAGAFERLAAGVRELHRIKPEYPVAARTTVQKLNVGRLRETVETARALGLSSISFLAADLTSAAFNRPQAWPAERQAEVGLAAGELPVLEQELAQMLPDPFIVETPEKLERIARHFRAHLGLEEPVAPRCDAPWVSAVVESDGAVRPCFFHAPIGNLAEGSLGDVLNSPRAIAFRQSLNVAENPICRRCVCSLYRSTPASAPDNGRG